MIFNFFSYSLENNSTKNKPEHERNIVIIENEYLNEKYR